MPATALGLIMFALCAVPGNILQRVNGRLSHFLILFMFS